MAGQTLLAGAALLASLPPAPPVLPTGLFERHLAGRTHRTVDIVFTAWEIIQEVLGAPDGRSKLPENVERVLLRYAKQKMKPGSPFRVSHTVAFLYRDQNYRTTTSKPKNIWAKAAEVLMMKETEVKNVYYSPAAAQLRKRLGMTEINSKTTKKKNLAAK